MNARIIIDGTIFELGDGLVSLELTKEFGLSASGVSVTMDFAALYTKRSDVLHRKPRERVPFEALINFTNGQVEEYFGFLEENRGEDSVRADDPVDIKIQSRGSLALLMDEVEGEDSRITKAYHQTPWSTVVADVVKRKGFTTKLIQSTKELAGEKRDGGRYFYSVDNLLPGEILSRAIAETGYMANVEGDRDFFFKPPSDLEPVTQDFFFRKRDPRSTIDTYSFSAGEIQNFSTRNQIIRIDPGQSLPLIINMSLYADPLSLSGRYYVTRSVYTINENGDNVAKYNVKHELPKLRTES